MDYIEYISSNEFLETRDKRAHRIKSETRSKFKYNKLIKAHTSFINTCLFDLIKFLNL